VTVAGISRDSLNVLERFRSALGLQFHLLYDEKGDVARSYRAATGHRNRRLTVTVAPDATITDVIEGFRAIDPDDAIQACAIPVRKT